MTDSSNKPLRSPTLEELVTSAEEALRTPLLIGELFGIPVYLNKWDRTITFGSLTTGVDHPYLVGTPLHRHALEILGEEP